jgi:hypothetical protein
MPSALNADGQKVRGANKKFWLRRPDGRGGWINGRDDGRKVLYRLPEVNEAIACGHLVIVAEGEKDVHNLWKIGVPATCSPDGAAVPGQRPKWCHEYNQMLRGADVVVMATTMKQAGPTSRLLHRCWWESRSVSASSIYSSIGRPVPRVATFLIGLRLAITARSSTAGAVEADGSRGACRRSRDRSGAFAGGRWS